MAKKGPVARAIKNADLAQKAADRGDFLSAAMYVGRAQDAARSSNGSERAKKAAKSAKRYVNKAARAAISATDGASGTTETGTESSDSSVQPTPSSPPWSTTPTFTAPTGVKQAEPDVVLLQEEGIAPELLTQLMIEDIGGAELINISRSDIIDGVNVSYSPIANLSFLRRKFNPNNIISTNVANNPLFSKFAIDLVSRGMNIPTFDADGNLVIEIDNVLQNEVIEVEISLDGTMYRVEL